MGGRPTTPDVCTIPECGGVVHARGWCAMHYQRSLKFGDPLAPGSHLSEIRPSCG